MNFNPKSDDILSESRIDEDLALEARYNQLYKIILIGDTNVGKTSIISKYLTGIFPQPSTCIPTIAAEFATKIIPIKEGGYIKAQIWDTAGQERYKSIALNHYRQSAGGLIVYDITNRASFESISLWLSELKQLAEKECVIALVGNKLDLVQKDNKKREVTKEEAQSFAYLNHLLFYETSAYNDDKLNNIFEEVIQYIYNERRKIYSHSNMKNMENKDTKIKFNLNEEPNCYFLENGDKRNGDNDNCSC